MKRFLLFCGTLFLMLAVPSFTSAQTVDDLPAGNQPDTVYAVFFYLPTCPHCHDVIDNVFPAWQSEFGDQLVIVPINASIDGTDTLFASACRAYSVDRCGSVPLLLIGDRFMLGSVDIPNIGTPLIRQLLASGGSPLPDFYGMDTYFSNYVESLGIQADEAVSLSPINSIASEDVTTNTDSAANILAVVVLLVLVASLFKIFHSAQQGQSITLSLSRLVLGIILLASVALALTLVATPEDNTSATLVAWGVLMALGIVTFMQGLTFADSTFKVIADTWAVPLITGAGLAVALYLTHIETTQSTAVCGAIGNCNAVQQSAYASVLGIPIGILGIIGYISIFIAWITWRRLQLPVAEKLLIVMILFGVCFSTYLTFLEPFIIGATCAWCLMSALMMLMLLWLILPQTETTLSTLLTPLSKRR